MSWNQNISERKFGIDTQNFRIRGLSLYLSSSNQVDIVLAIWCKCWDTPDNWGFELVSDGGGLLVVLVVQGCAIPVDVDVDVGESACVTKDASEVQAGVLTFDGWRGRSESVYVIESEDSNVIVTLRESDDTWFGNGPGG